MWHSGQEHYEGQSGDITDGHYRKKGHLRPPSPSRSRPSHLAGRVVGAKFVNIRNITIFVTEYRSFPILDWGVPGWERVI